jgi:hypothetical protein
MLRTMLVGAYGPRCVQVFEIAGIAFAVSRRYYGGIASVAEICTAETGKYMRKAL